MLIIIKRERTREWKSELYLLMLMDLIICGKTIEAKKRNRCV